MVVHAFALQQPPGHSCGLHVHAPPEHVWVAEHRLLHVPQLFGSVVVLKQPLPHDWKDAEHEIAHVVPLHEGEPVADPVVGPGHAVPQRPPLPQLFCGLGSWQVPPQLTLPVGHLHWLLWQVIPPEHAVVQLPQYEALLVVSTQVDPQAVDAGALQPETHA